MKLAHCKIDRVINAISKCLQNRIATWQTNACNKCLFKCEIERKQAPLHFVHTFQWMCQTLTPLKIEGFAVPCACRALPSTPNTLLLLFPKDWGFFFHTSFLSNGHSQQLCQMLQGENTCNTALPAWEVHQYTSPTFLETIVQTEKKQVALSQLVTLSPSLPPSFIWKSKGLAAKYISPSFQAGSVCETWQETAFDKNPSLSTSERALSFISTPLPVHKHRASGVSAGGTAFLSGSYNSEAAPIIFFCHLWATRKHNTLQPQRNIFKES